jgi:hypothetical protein
MRTVKDCKSIFQDVLNSRTHKHSMKDRFSILVGTTNTKVWDAITNLGSPCVNNNFTMNYAP